MSKEETEIAIDYLEDMKEKYIEGHGYERHPLPEYYAIESAIKALKQGDVLDKIKEEVENLKALKYSTGERVYRDEVIDIIDKYKGEE